MRVSDHCFAVTGLYYANPWAVNAGFILGERTTLVIDSGSNRLAAQTIYGYAKGMRPANEILLVNTEKHLDHMGGNGYFQEQGVPIFGHRSIQRKQEEFDAMVQEMNQEISSEARKEHREGHIPFQNTRIVNPTTAIPEEPDLAPGDTGARILPTPGHTKSNLSIHHEKEGVLYCGDCLLPDYLPNLEDGNSDDWNQWIESLERILELDIEILIPGHGNILTGKDNIEREARRIAEILKKAIQGVP